ncbi:MAG: hypothetical protein COB53_07285 [Elusimicrobia bacterium]|nr:MAG: hypothetical protein COB53_07285 [Elusimicrobiota bacterium]
MSAKRISIFLLCTFGGLALSTAAFAANGPLLVNLKIHAKIAVNAGLAGGVKIPITPAPPITQLVAVGEEAPKKKGELEDLFATFVLRDVWSHPKSFNRFARWFKVKGNIENELIIGAETTDKKHTIFVRDREDDEVPLIIIMDTSTGDLFLFHTSTDGVLRGGITSKIGGKTRRMKADEAAEPFKQQKKFWLDQAEKINRKALESVTPEKTN